MGFGDFFRRVLIPVRQRPSSEDLNALQWVVQMTGLAQARQMFGYPSNSSGSRTLADSLLAFGPRGFYGAGFYVAVDAGAPPFGLSINPGHGYNYSGPSNTTNIDSNQGADWNTAGILGAPLVLSNYQQLTVPAPPAVGSSRIDLIEVSAAYIANNPQTVGIFDPGSSTFNPTVSNKSLTWDLLGRTGSVNAPNPSTAPISYVVGQSAVGDITAATEPTTTPGYVRIARVNLDASGGPIAAVTQDMVVDYRPLLTPQATVRVSGRVTVPGIAAGIGSEAVDALDLPPGYQLKVLFQNNVPPGVGDSYTAIFYLFGGELRPTTAPASRGTVVGTASSIGGNRGLGYGAILTGTVGLTDQTYLNGGDPNVTVVNGIQDFPIGQPYVFWTMKVFSISGALNNTETFNFQFSMNLG